MKQSLTYQMAADLLAHYHIPIVKGGVAKTVEEAKAIQKTIGFPVCLKIDSPQVLHRTEIGGVKTGIFSLEYMVKAFNELLALPLFLAPDCKAGLEGIIVQKMLKTGVEFLVGAKKDPVFGHVISFGLGGIFTEAIKTFALRPVPLSTTEARDLIQTINQKGVLSRLQKRTALPFQELTALLTNLSRLLLENPWISELDLNPVICVSDGPFAVDIVLIKDDSAETDIVEPPRFPVESVAPFFQPASVAVIGASRNPDKGGHVILQNLKTFGFKGPVYPINPQADQILGFQCYPDLAGISGPVDLAIIIVPKEGVNGAVSACIEKKVKAVILVTAGFSDTGLKGRQEEADLRQRLNDQGIRLMGPNSIGTISPSKGLATSITTLYRLERGPVSIFGQTGIFASGVANQIVSSEAYGISKIACIGNRGDIDESDLLEYFIADPETEIIGLYVEGIKKGRRFLALLESARGKKEIVVLKAGKSEQGAQALGSHTGSLAVDDVIFDGLCQKTGLIRVRDMEEFLDVIRFLALVGRPTGNRLAAVSISGMACVNTADLAPDYGFLIPGYSPQTIAQIRRFMPEWAPLHNPTDIWSTIERQGPAKAYEEISLAALKDPQIDLLFLIFLLIHESTFDVEALIQKLRPKACGKPIFAAIIGGGQAVSENWRKALEQNGVPCFSGVDRALKTAALAMGGNRS